MCNLLVDAVLFAYTNEIGLCLVTATEQVFDAASASAAAAAVEFKQRGVQHTSASASNNCRTLQNPREMSIVPNTSFGLSWTRLQCYVQVPELLPEADD